MKTEDPPESASGANLVLCSLTDCFVSNTSKRLKDWISFLMATAHAQGLFSARTHNKKSNKNAKNVFYNVQVNAQSDFCVLLVASNISLSSISFFPEYERVPGCLKNLSMLAWELK